MQSDNIIEKARQLGLNTGNSSSSADNLRTIASQVGLSDFNSMYDLNKLENILDQRLSEAREAEKANISDIEQLDNGGPIRNEKFGQKEYDKAKKDGVYDSNHYKAKQQELDKKAEELNQERQKNWKMKNGENGPVKADGSNTKRKSNMDRVIDNFNYAKAKKDAITNKIDEAKANTYNALHPVEHAKNLAESKVENAVNQAKKQVGNKAKMAAKAAGKKIVTFIAANPWILIIVGALILILFIILSFGALDSNKNGYYNQECNFNASIVNLSSCGEDESQSMDLKSYVLGTTYSLVNDSEFNDEAIKAIMIIVKTNAMSYGGYDNSSKTLMLDTCTYEFKNLDSDNENYEKYNELYSEIENYLYLSSSYNTAIDSLSLNNSLTLDEDVLKNIKEIDGNFDSILSSLYNDEESEDVIYTNNLFVGDSRIQEMKDYGVVDSSKVIYGSGYGYNWFVGNGTFNGGNTNAINGAIDGISKKVKENTNYNIIIWLGVNDLGYVDASTYFNKYSELAQGEWANYNLYIVEVGPVNEDASISNNDINEFNNSMNSLINNSGLNNIKYIDIAYNINTFDNSGLHYGSSDYSNIYSQIMKNVTSNVSSNYKLYSLDDYCEFITIDKDGQSNACESMSISSTALSRDEFIAKLESYYSNSSATYSDLFKENAGTIYDLATSNGINPEVVVVRAFLEGYSPASKGYPNYYNYWGLRCYNNQPLKTCASYNSFESGVLGFINNISKYESLSSMMKKYTYIGSYWYNPGDSGAGGCYYYPYIKKYMSAQRANEVAGACQSGKTCEGSSCLKTNDEDQLAYSMWQVEKMASQRNTMFNINSDFCDGYSQNCTIYAQGDSRWKNISLGKSSTNMGDSGCAVTSIAIGISCSGTEVTVANFDAGKFLNKLNEGSCFTDEGAINWGCNAITQIAPKVRKIYSESNIRNNSDSYKLKVINEYNVNNNFVIVHFKNSKHPRGHYVVVSKVSGNNLITKDPSGGKVTTISVSIVDQIVAYSA